MKKPKLSVVVPLGPGRDEDVIRDLKHQKEPVKIFIERGTNTSKNRNKGISKTKTDYVGFVNGHSILPKDWSLNVLAFFKKHPKVDVVGGPQLTSKDEELFERVSGYALNSKFATANVSQRYGSDKLKLNAGEFDITSANLICKKKVVKKVKFDEKVYPGEDPKFIIDAKKAGFKVAYSPDIVAHHKRREDFGGLSKQIFTYAKTRSSALRKTILKNPLFLVPAFFLIYLVIFGVLSLIHNIFLFPILLYIVLSFGFSLYWSVKEMDFLALFLLPFVFFTIHISYGLGILRGLISK